MSDPREVRAINYAASSAAHLIRMYALTYQESDEYEPLEDLAMDVQRLILERWCQIMNEEKEEVA